MNRAILIAALVVAVGVGGYLIYKWKFAPDKLGDLDDDGKLTQNDITILEYYILEYPISDISPLSEEEFLRRADVNKNGVIDMSDVTALEILMGL